MLSRMNKESMDIRMFSRMNKEFMDIQIFSGMNIWNLERCNSHLIVINAQVITNLSYN